MSYVTRSQEETIALGRRLGSLLREGDVLVLTGDLGEEGELALLQLYGKAELDCDILKAGHHGSRYSSSEAFLDAAAPEAAVISCGQNNSYGHPHKETIERLKAAGAEIFRTDTGGAVLVRIDNKKIRISNCIPNGSGEVVK